MRESHNERCRNEEGSNAIGCRRPPNNRSESAPLLIRAGMPTAGNSATSSPLSPSESPTSSVRYDEPQLFTNRYSEYPRKPRPPTSQTFLFRRTSPNSARDGASPPLRPRPCSSAKTGLIRRTIPLNARKRNGQPQKPRCDEWTRSLTECESDWATGSEHANSSRPPRFVDRSAHDVDARIPDDDVRNAANST